MPRTVGRHRAPRRSPLRRPAVAATASLSALAVSAAGYANNSPAAVAESGSDAPASGARVMADAPSAARSGADVATARFAAGTGLSAQAQQRAAAAQRLADAQTSARRAQVAKVLDQSSTMRSMAAQQDDAEKKADGSRASRAGVRPDVRDGKPVVAAAQKSTKRAGSTEQVSRSSTRSTATATASSRTATASAAPATRSSGSPKAIARSMAAARGWGADQFSCLDKLWTKESSWRVNADNPSSSAYGIPQALPGSKMASIGSDWRTNAATQIAWGLGYISERYGSPCSAWGHSVAVNWY